MPLIRVAELEIDPAQLEATRPRCGSRSRIGERRARGCLRFHSVAEKDASHRLRFFEIYFSLRSKWDGKVAALAEFMAVDAHIADPIGTNPQSATDRPEFAATRLHSAG